MRTSRFHTFGCKVNQYDTQAIREGILKAGYREVGPGERAGLHVVNTCTVTAEGDRKARQLVRRIARENPGARIVVTGCSATRDPDAYRLLPGVALVAGGLAKERIAQILGAPPSPFRITRFSGHTRAFLKVEDGCDDHCTFCIIPKVRGEVRSRPPEEVRREAIRLAGSGHREIVLTGIHLGHYGRGESYTLADVLRALADVPVDRIRLSSLEAIEVGEDLLRAAAENGKICPHFHLPLQSGNDRVLRRMGRPYTRADFADRVRLIREHMADPEISTDIIVGFPGEDEQAFADTLEYCREIGFSRIHVFPYSERAGTPAVRLGGSVPVQVRRARGRTLSSLARELSSVACSRWVGREVEVLTEVHRDGFLYGKTERYLPARIPGGPEDRNRIIRAKAATYGPDGLRLPALSTEAA